jgi:unsaturated rhamnogalacturonyl hydrolase
MLDHAQNIKWDYVHGLELMSFQKLYEATHEKKYYDYVKTYLDTMLTDGGNAIRTYKLENYNIDMINAGKLLYPFWNETGDSIYANAIKLLRSQMLAHPRTSEGGFWHKQVYPHQMWLDGLYMGSPFLAQYAAEFDETTLFDDVAHQFILMAKHAYDPATGLYYHGWDESREQAWANRETGQSPNFWSRSLGWYIMALADVLDFLPETHPQRSAVLDIFVNLSASLENFRDPQTGMWYQVTDKVGAEGNYVEATGSIMFIYAWAKGAKNAYLNKTYQEKASEAYDSFIKTFVVENSDGTISITNCCSVAGLGGNPYRDGSYQYYVNERRGDNDPKAVGPFILASLLLNK